MKFILVFALLVSTSFVHAEGVGSDAAAQEKNELALLDARQKQKDAMAELAKIMATAGPGIVNFMQQQKKAEQMNTKMFKTNESLGYPYGSPALAWGNPYMACGPSGCGGAMAEKEMTPEKLQARCISELKMAAAGQGLPLTISTEIPGKLVVGNGKSTKIYSEAGMVEVNGTTCKAAESSQKYSDGIIAAVSKFVTLNRARAKEIKNADLAKFEKAEAIGVLSNCGKVDAKVHAYADKTLYGDFGVSPTPTPAPTPTPGKPRSSHDKITGAKGTDGN